VAGIDFDVKSEEVLEEYHGNKSIVEVAQHQAEKNKTNSVLKRNGNCVTADTLLL